METAKPSERVVIYWRVLTIEALRPIVSAIDLIDAPAPTRSAMSIRSVSDKYRAEYVQGARTAVGA
jgi:hypothetical protein